MPAKRAAAKPKPMAAHGASGGGGGAAVPASRAKARPRATTTRPRAAPLERGSRSGRRRRRRRDATKTKPTNSPARPAPIRPPNGERRPRRRGRRGGRRRRGGPEDGLAGSIADELGPASAPEVSSAVADFDGNPSEPRCRCSPNPKSIAPAHEQQPVDRAQPEPARAATATEAETAQEAERAAARRRSTVREKVSFLVDAQPAAPSPVSHSQPCRAGACPRPAPAQPAAETTADTQPRRAGWWSRRFGNGE